jgi:hypothetical protein
MWNITCEFTSEQRKLPLKILDNQSKQKSSISYTLTNSMEMNTIREATSCSATQELHSTLWNPKVYHRIHMSPLLVPVLNQANPVHSIACHLTNIHLNITYPPTPWS